MTAEAILRLVNDPVLPFYPLDIALDVQNKLKVAAVLPFYAEVLLRLLENRLFIKKKCKFHASQVSFLRFILKEGQVQVDPEKVIAVAEWPTPTNQKLLQCFLGFDNFYRHFVRNYSQEAAPLTALTSPSCPFT
ncbi:hypothetical protein L3Q82_007842 [Scortum barcoo]|uniref:Uncharacterized protein n=1 Tax=Scortum barcoo TaxID=214431 RepID=A0ACB8WK62_9TELE|nr:hypothetical protein L3Q82_007842 [Scortum barcoo]